MKLRSLKKFIPCVKGKSDYAFETLAESGEFAIKRPFYTTVWFKTSVASSTFTAVTLAVVVTVALSVYFVPSNRIYNLN
jgi:hypothetical protein